MARLTPLLEAPVPLGELLASRFVETAVGSAVGLGAAVLMRRRRTTSPAAR